MCLVCLDKIGDEFHFLLECPRHQSLRSRLIGRYYWNRPSMLKLQQLLNSTCTNVIRAVAKFVYKAFNDLWFYVIHVCRFCTFCMFWYPVAILCNCVRHADQMFLSRMTFVRARGPKTIIKSLNPWILESYVHKHAAVTHKDISSTMGLGILLSLTLSQWSSSGFPVAIQCAWNSDPSVHWNATGEMPVCFQWCSSGLPVAFQWSSSVFQLCKLTLDRHWNTTGR